MEKLRLGHITNAAGLKGEIKVYPYTDYKEKFEEIDYVLIEDRKYSIEKVRYIKEMAILKLEGINNRNDAEKNKGKDLYILRCDAPPLPEGSYYVKDLIGLTVIDEDGTEIGKLKDVIINGVQDLYEVMPVSGNSPFLIPAVEEFVNEVNIEEGFVRVHLIEGLMDL